MSKSRYIFRQNVRNRICQYVVPSAQKKSNKVCVCLQKFHPSVARATESDERERVTTTRLADRFPLLLGIDRLRTPPRSRPPFENGKLIGFPQRLCPVKFDCSCSEIFKFWDLGLKSRLDAFTFLSPCG